MARTENKKVDIHNREKNLERNTAKYISRLFQDDQEDVRRFINDHLANGYSFGRVDKIYGGNHWDESHFDVAITIKDGVAVGVEVLKR